jgi:CelD/BcsL family acetyltransferase involved in cellulose biosynthesis
MQTYLVGEVDALHQVAKQWRELPIASPMNSPDWLISWWNHFGCPSTASKAIRIAGAELFCILVVEDDGTLIGLAPWYIVRNSLGIRTIRYLGDGHVCSDHLSILAATERTDAVCQRIADFLMTDLEQDWDAIDLEAIDHDDPVMTRFAQQMGGAHGCMVQSREMPCTWRFDLPTSWDELIDSLSKNRRKKLRRKTREYFDSGRAVFRVLNQPNQINEFADQLFRLHRLRWATATGPDAFRPAAFGPGTFGSAEVELFHRDTFAGLLATESLELAIAELDGQIIAAEYNLKNSTTRFAYQAGIDPAVYDISPGEISLAMAIRHAIDTGAKRFDFLRGDEDYKSAWGAESRPAYRLRIQRPVVRGYLDHYTDETKTVLRKIKRLIST